MSGEDGDSAAPPAKKLKLGPVVARETTGHISFVVPNANGLTDSEVKSAQKLIGGLVWQLVASKGRAPNNPAKSALLFRLLASHPSGRTTNWAAITKAVVTVQPPPGTERQPIRSEFTASYGDWNEDGSDEANFLAHWEVVESAEEGYIDLEKNSLSLGCDVEITKVNGVWQPLKALFNEDCSFSDVCLVAGGRKFYVNRSQMSLHSEVLSSMLMGGFVEGEKKEIDLAGVDPDGFEAFLNKRLLISDQFNLRAFFDILERAAINVEELFAIIKTEDVAKLSERSNSAILHKLVALRQTTSNTGGLRMEEAPTGGYNLYCSICSRIVCCSVACPQCP